MIIIDHPFPLQPLTGASWMSHPLENPAEVLGLVVSPIRDVGQPRQWAVPLAQHVLDQGRQLARQRLWRSLGVGGASGSDRFTEPRGQTDLEFLLEKILNRSDPKEHKEHDPKEHIEELEKSLEYPCEGPKQQAGDQHPIGFLLEGCPVFILVNVTR